jgi:uncharacterized membrane protein YccC
MITVLALSLSDPMTLMFGVILTVLIGCGAGYVIGTSLGRTEPGVQLPTALRLSRDRLSSASTRLENASSELARSRRPELAGSTLALARRVSEVSTALGAIERKVRKGGSA